MTRHTSRAGGGRNVAGQLGDDGSEVDTAAALDALDDPDCLALLEATNTEPRTVSELVDLCDVPRSTTYRKVDRLVEAGLLEERVRLGWGGSHASEYRLAVEDIVVTISSGEVEVGARRPATGAD